MAGTCRQGNRTYPVYTKIYFTALLVFIAFIIIALVPLFVHDLFSPCYNLVNWIHKTTNGIMGFGASAIIAELLRIFREGNKKVNNSEEKKARITYKRTITAIIVFFTVITSGCKLDAQAFDLYEEILPVSYDDPEDDKSKKDDNKENPQSDDNNNNNTDYADNAENVEDYFPEEDRSTFIFNIYFPDVLYTKYSVSDLEIHKYSLGDQILKALVNTPETDDTVSKDKEKYKNYIDLALEYESVYTYIYKNNLFKNNINIRIDEINNCINTRENADNCFKSSANRNMLALRYKDMADEYRRMYNKTDEAIAAYKNSIYWNLSGLQTSYSEKEFMNNREKMVNDIITCLECIADTTIDTDDIHKRALVLTDVYNYILELL